VYPKKDKPICLRFDLILSPHALQNKYTGELHYFSMCFQLTSHINPPKLWHITNAVNQDWLHGATPPFSHESSWQQNNNFTLPYTDGLLQFWASAWLKQRNHTKKKVIRDTVRATPAVWTQTRAKHSCVLNKRRFEIVDAILPTAGDHRMFITINHPYHHWRLWNGGGLTINFREI
jgi:hypothetical protein